jgi:hypothetical protein
MSTNDYLAKDKQREEKMFFTIRVDPCKSVAEFFLFF